MLHIGLSDWSEPNLWDIEYSAIILSFASFNKVKTGITSNTTEKVGRREKGEKTYMVPYLGSSILVNK